MGSGAQMKNIQQKRVSVGPVSIWGLHTKTASDHTESAKGSSHWQAAYTQFASLSSADHEQPGKAPIGVDTQHHFPGQRIGETLQSLTHYSLWPSLALTAQHGQAAAADECWAPADSCSENCRCDLCTGHNPLSSANDAVVPEVV